MWCPKLLCEDTGGNPGWKAHMISVYNTECLGAYT